MTTKPRNSILGQAAHTPVGRPMGYDEALFSLAHEYAAEYMEAVSGRRVTPAPEDVEALRNFDEPIPDEPAKPLETLRKLHRFGSPGTMAQTGGRYFGFVNGGVLPEALASRWLIDSWDQNTALEVMSPVGSRLEQVSQKWLVDLLGLPRQTVAGFTNGTSAALLCCLTAARHALLERQGWDVSAQGLHGAPRIRVLGNRHSHAAVLRALQVLGLGTNHFEPLQTDDQGRILLSALPELDESTLLLTQAGDVNSGSFDPFRELGERAHEANAWMHVDGAFGLWASASRSTCHLTDGVELANSWSVDAHKTLNGPYECGIALCRERDALVKALQTGGSYFPWGEKRDGMAFTLDMSRRARGAELWATLHTLGRSGVEALVDHLCGMARRLSRALRELGFVVPNDVVFNQVMVKTSDGSDLGAIIAELQRSGECWCGGSRWLGEPVIRVSICSHATTEADIDRTAAAFDAARRRVAGS